MAKANDSATARTLSCAEGAELVIKARAGEVVVVIHGDAEVEVSRGTVVEKPEVARLAAPIDERVKKALDVLRGAPAQRWTVRTLARAVGASRATLARAFASGLGQTPGAWLSAHRLELARGLLTETNAALAEIAQRTGYASEFALGRAFKRRFGQAPGSFRKTARRAALVRAA